MHTPGRLLAIYDRLLERGRGIDTQMIKVWAEVFEIAEDNPRLEDEVAVLLQAMRAEMDLLHVELEAIGIKDELMNPGITRLRNITLPSYSGVGWHGLFDEATRAENRLSLAWAEWALDGELEKELSSSELLDLMTELDSLEASLNSKENPPVLQEFLQRQIDAIRAALKVYRVRGIKPIHESLNQVVGACSSKIAQDIVQAAPDATDAASAKFFAFFRKAATAAGYVNTVFDTASNFQSLARGLEKLAIGN